MAKAVSAICIAEGIPMFIIFFSIPVSMRSRERCSFTQDLVRKRTVSVSTAEMSCDMTVASATPATPISSTKTKSISSRVFVIAQAMRK